MPSSTRIKCPVMIERAETGTSPSSGEGGIHVCQFSRSIGTLGLGTSPWEVASSRKQPYTIDNRMVPALHLFSSAINAGAMMPLRNVAVGGIKMAEFFVYVCSQCDEAYAGALEAGERRIGRQESGICPECLERLFGLNGGVESPQKSSGETPKA